MINPFLIMLVAGIVQLPFTGSEANASSRIPLPALLKSKTKESFYPEAAVRNNAQGLIEATFRISALGEPAKVTIVSPNNEVELIDAGYKKLNTLRFSVPTDWESSGMAEHEFKMVIEFTMNCSGVSGSAISTRDASDDQWTDGWIVISNCVADRGRVLPKFDLGAMQLAAMHTRGYPAGELKRWVQGLVIVAFRISAKGRAKDPVIVNPGKLPGLEKAALSYAKHWKFLLPEDWVSSGKTELQLKIGIEYRVKSCFFGPDESQQSHSDDEKSHSDDEEFHADDEEDFERMVITGCNLSSKKRSH